jgi:arylformamidase
MGDKMTDYRTMDKETLEREYSPSSCIDDIMVYINRYISQSARAREKLEDNIVSDIKYGPEERSIMDLFIPETKESDGIKNHPIHIYIHGGYWQELSKNESQFAAPNFINHDIIFIALDYQLAPKASMAEIIDQVCDGVLTIVKTAHTFGGDMSNITISGSSAGAHLVMEVMSMDWNKHGFESCPIKGACAVSGIYDMQPLVNTYVNDPLKMTITDAKAASPLFHIPKPDKLRSDITPTIFSYGENETSEFKRQTNEYRAAWNAAGHKSHYIEMLVFNHFDVIMELGNSQSPLFKAVLQQIQSLPKLT